MTPTAEDLTRAELYARSAAFIRTANGKTAAVFERRGQRLAGDQWSAVYGRATGTMAPEPTPEAEPTKSQKADAEALERECPECHAEPGMKCHNYKGKNCAPHSGRK